MAKPKILKYLAVIEYRDRRGNVSMTACKPFHSHVECDEWIAELLQEHGRERVICYITEIVFCISG